jgi:hypothetical protein
MFDSTCQCECIEKGEDCDGVFDYGSCTCIPDSCSLKQVDCPRGTKWDTERCNCETIKCPRASCGLNYFFKEDCSCYCGLEGCEEPYWLDIELCACVPVFVCDFELPCEDGDVWNGDSDVCSCVPAQWEISFELMKLNTEILQNCQTKEK